MPHNQFLMSLQTALRTSQRNTLFRKYLPTLSDAISAFGADLSLFPADEKVQKPLQNNFAMYMECYEMMLQHLESSSCEYIIPEWICIGSWYLPALDFDFFLEHVKVASLTIATYKEEWEEHVDKATKELAAAKQLSTQYSYYNGTLGPLNPYTTRVSFEWQETIGRGTYGEVTKVRETSTGTFYAQKVIRVADPSSKIRIEKEVLNEVSIMQKLRHRHIASVQFHVFEADRYSIIMLPVAEYDLLYFLCCCVDSKFLRTELAYFTSWFDSLIGALAFAHSKQIKHGDIKPKNI